MDKEVLVKNMRNFTELLENEKGEIKLAILVPHDGNFKSRYYTYIISAKWIDEIGLRDGIKYMFDKLKNTFDDDTQKCVVVITVYDIKDPFVEIMNDLYPVTQEIKYIANINFYDREINYGVLFESKR